MTGVEIIQVSQLGRGIWVVHYYQYAASQGCCGSLLRSRKSVVIKQEQEPTQKNIDDAIQNQKSGTRT